jgi:calcineurin-like phosphoesterase family protein
MKFAPETRKGHSVADEMDAEMIQIWNDTVSLTDEVYLLGDFSFRDSKKTEEILKQLKGRLHFIFGNHDQWLTKNYNNMSKYFESIQHYKKLKLDGKDVIMFHYPIYEWEKMHYGSYHLFGHVHGNVQIDGRAIDVGIDARPQKDMGLWSWEEIDALLSNKKVRSHHGKTNL